MSEETKTPVQLLAEKFQLVVELDDFSQNQLETYQTELVKFSREKAETVVTLVMTQKDNEANAVLNGATARAAIKAGILKGIEADLIGAQNPAAVTLLARAVRQHIKEITEVPLE